MEALFLLSLSLWLSVNVAYADQATPPDRLIDLITDHPKSYSSPDETLEVLKELQEDYADSEAVRSAVEGKTSLMDLILLSDPIYWTDLGDSFNSSELSQSLIKWVDNMNVAEYIFQQIKDNHKGEEDPIFVKEYIKRIWLMYVRSDMRVKKWYRDESWKKLRDDSEMDPQDTYELLSDLIQNSEPDKMVDELRLLQQPRLPYCKRETPIQRLSDPKHPLLKVPKVAVYLNYLEKLEQEDCQFMSMSRQDRQALPVIDTFDCDRLLVKNRLEHGKRELYDISRAIAKDPSKCPRFKDSAEYFAINAKLFSCSGRDCCEATERFLTSYFQRNLPYVPVQESDEAQNICHSLIKEQVMSELPSLIPDISKLRGRLNFHGPSELDELLSKEVSNWATPKSKRRQKLDILQQTLKEPCENISKRLSFLQSIVVSRIWASKSLGEVWYLLYLCDTNMKIIDAMVQKLSCKSGRCL